MIDDLRREFVGKPALGELQHNSDHLTGREDGLGIDPCTFRAEVDDLDLVGRGVVHDF